MYTVAIPLVVHFTALAYYYTVIVTVGITALVGDDCTAHVQS